ncbi:hypothetical protein [Streptococcus sobrinus]|uniref:hypothetical protein n=1 Tax=Streptococcus sobrinus TaxID=1310 RepID=UPI0002ED00E9|nr:hypothetical protein [Streptococcus sobrinus]
MIKEEHTVVLDDFKTVDAFELSIVHGGYSARNGWIIIDGPKIKWEDLNQPPRYGIEPPGFPAILVEY